MTASEKNFKDSQWVLTERIKELECLYYISSSIRRHETMEEILQEVVDFIPAAWQYPEITRVRIHFGDLTFLSKDFKESKWVQSADIFVNGKNTGSVEVYYVELRPTMDEGPFLKEERRLIQEISALIGETIHRENVKEELLATNQHLMAANQQLQAVEQQLRASNQQLYANEQQLKASNQQLAASEQQLRSAVIQLTANEKELRISKEKAETNEQYYHTIINKMGDPVFVKDAQSRLLLVNDAFCDLFGLERTLIIGKTLAEDVSPEERESFLKIDKEVIETGIENISEESLTVRDGQTRFISTRKTRYVDDYGNKFLIGIIRDFTEAKKIRDAIKESALKYKTLFDSVPIGLTVADKTGVITESNKMAEALLGLSAEDQQKRKIDGIEWQMIRPDGSPFPPEEYASVKALKEHRLVENVEMGIVKNKEEITWINVSAVPFNFSDQGVLIAYLDITERKLAEERVIAANLELEKTELIAGMGGWSIDVKTMSPYLSRGAQEIYEIDPEAIPPVEEGITYYTPEHRPVIQKAVQECVQSGTPYELELQIITAKGNKRWVRTGGSAEFSNGSIVKVTGFIQDITKLKVAELELQSAYQQLQANEQQLRASFQQLEASEQQLRASNQQLAAQERALILAKERAEKSEERLRLVIKGSNDAPWDWDLIGNELYYSPQWWQQIGYEPNELKPDSDLWESLMCPDDKEQVDNIFGNALKTGQESYAVEFRLLHKKGFYVPVLSRGFITYDENKKPIRVSGTNLDLTAQKKAEQALNQAREKAEESDRLKSAFLANMSHEIRTPMNGILGFTSLLLEPDLNDETKERYIEIIRKSGDRMLNTVNDIIEISKIEAGLTEVKKSEIDVNAVLKNLILFFQLQAHQKGLVLSSENVEAGLFIYTDLSKFESILTNLIKNAIKFTIKGRIDVSFGVKDGFVQFCVKDTGIGIPQNRIHAIFNRFEQADIEDIQGFQGSGLGLTIAKSYVEILGGSIWVESVEGEGSTFCFTLPYLSPPGKSDVSGINPKNENNAKQFKQPKILIVEDDDVSADFLQLILNKTATTIIIADSGKMAIELCKTHTDIDVILMDIKMPGIDGFEATRRIREFNKEVIIIAQTAYALSGDKEKAISAGFNDYVTKPVRKSELVKMISKQLSIKEGKHGE